MSDRRKLPDGWQMVFLRDVIEDAQSGFASGEREPNGAIQLRMNNVGTRGNLVWDEYIRVPTTQEQLAKYQLQEGDVVFNNTNSTELVGKSALFKDFSEPVVYSNHFTRLRARRNLLDPAYLASWLMRQWQTKLFERICNRWIGQSAVKPSVLLELEIPLPPLPEQRRIAAVLEEKLAAVEQARQAARAQLDAARALPAAYLREIFEGDEAREWPIVELGELGVIGTGSTPATDELTFYEGTIPLIKTAQITNNRIDYAEVHISELARQKYNLKLYPIGTVLMGMYGQGKTRGQVAILDIPATTTQNAAAIVPNENLLSEYLWYWLRRQYLHLRHLGFHGELAHLSLQYVRELKIPLPSVESQRGIVGYLSSRFSSVERLIEQLDQQLTEIEAMRAAYLQQAFSGEL